MGYEEPKLETGDSIDELNKQENLVEDFQPFVEAALLKAVKVNEGNNGIITRVDISDIPSEMLDYLYKNCPNLFSSEDIKVIATKILKIYSEGAGRREAEMQDKAGKLVEGSSREDLAMIPRLILNQDIEVTSAKLRKHLHESGIRHVGDNIEIIMMNFIDGEDLATYIYKKIVSKHGRLRDVQQRLEEGEEIEFDYLQQRVNEALGFDVPGQKHGDERLNDFERNKVFNENAKKVIDYVKEADIVLDPRIFELVNNTLQLLHKNGIYHLDMHERNIMMTFDDEGKVQDVYIIDFGSAKESDVPDVQEERMEDMAILTRYKDVTIDASVRQAKANADYERLLHNTEKRIMGSKMKEAWSEISGAITESFDMETEEAVGQIQKVVDGKLTSFSRLDTDFFFDLLSVLIVKIGKQNMEVAEKYLDTFLQKDDRRLLPVKNSLKHKTIPLLQSYKK